MNGGWGGAVIPESQEAQERTTSTGALMSVTVSADQNGTYASDIREAGGSSLLAPNPTAPPPQCSKSQIVTRACASSRTRNTSIADKWGSGTRHRSSATKWKRHDHMPMGRNYGICIRSCRYSDEEWYAAESSFGCAQRDGFPTMWKRNGRIPDSKHIAESYYSCDKANFRNGIRKYQCNDWRGIRHHLVYFEICWMADCMCGHERIRSAVYPAVDSGIYGEKKQTYDFSTETPADPSQSPTTATHVPQTTALTSAPPPWPGRLQGR